MQPFTQSFNNENKYEEHLTYLYIDSFFICSFTVVQHRFDPKTQVGDSRTGRSSKVVTLTLCPMPPFPPSFLARGLPRPPSVQKCQRGFSSRENNDDTITKTK